MALVVFLRGRNVGGFKTFRPKLLAEQLKRYDVINVGAAGTFVVRKPIGHAKFRADLLRSLPFEPDIMICEGRDLIRVVALNPFAQEGPVTSDIVRFVSILARRPRRARSIPINLPAEGDWGLRIIGMEGRFLFGLYRRQMKAISYLGAIDALFGMPATTRNWNTINTVIKVLELSPSPAA